MKVSLSTYWNVHYEYFIYIIISFSRHLPGNALSIQAVAFSLEYLYFLLFFESVI